MSIAAQPSIWTNQNNRIALDALTRFKWSVFPHDAEERPSQTGKLHPDGQPQRLGWKRFQTLQASPSSMDLTPQPNTV